MYNTVQLVQWFNKCYNLCTSIMSNLFSCALGSLMLFKRVHRGVRLFHLVSDCKMMQNVWSKYIRFYTPNNVLSIRLSVYDIFYTQNWFTYHNWIILTNFLSISGCVVWSWWYMKIQTGLSNPFYKIHNCHCDSKIRTSSKIDQC